MSKDFYIKAIAGGGDMLKSVYDTDVDGVVDSAERIQIVVRNSTGSTLTKGQIVYLSGATGNRPNAVLAQANSEATSSKTIGMVIANIANNTDGQIAVNGTLHDIDTSAFTAGDMLWLSATTAGGVVANTPPAEPNHAVFIGYVARVHPTQGRVVLAIQNGYELDELHGVQITSVANNDTLKYNSTSGLWVNAQPSIINKQTITDGTAITGTTVSTKTASVLIPANCVAVGDVLHLVVRARKVGILGSYTIRCYVNTSDAIGGAIVATSASSGSNALYSQIRRFLAVKTSTNTESFPSTVGVAADDGLTGTIVTASNINWAVDQYLVVALQNAVISDSSRSSFIQVQINKG